MFLSLERSYHFCFTSFCCHLSFCFSVVVVVVVVVLFYSSYIHFDICCLEIDVVVVVVQLCFAIESSLLHCFYFVVVVFRTVDRLIELVR